MPQRKIGRREFLKLAIASAAAAGLSHFRILNIGGVDVAYAQHDECAVGPPPVPDICAVGASPDTCPEGATPPIGNTDSCDPINSDPDFCEPFDLGEPDECAPPGTIPDDVCDANDGDICVLIAPDICECGGADSPDACDGSGNPDACTPSGFGAGDPDVCPDPPPGDGDICYTDNLGISEQDDCPPGPSTEDQCPGPPTQPSDICDPTGGDPDDPNPVTVGSVGVESASSILPSLGGVAAALGAAALWLRHRLRPEKPEEPETE